MAAKRTGLGRGLDALIRETGTIGKENSKADKPEKGNVKKTAKKTAVTAKKANAAGKKPEDQEKKKASAKNVEPQKKIKEKTAAPAKEANLKEKAAAPAKEANPKEKAAAPVKEANTKEKAASSEKETNIKEKASTETKKEINTNKGEQMVRISLVEPNREQPRKTFTDESIKELADSIRQFGVIQPLLVQAKDDHYEIIAGERRWRAAKEAGLKEIPVLVRDYSSQEAVEVSLIENIQREDLNPIEEAKAYRNLMADFDLNQEDVAKRVSKSRAAVANSMRLLKLDPRVQDMVIENQLAEGHARALLAIEDGDKQLSVAKDVVKDHMSVRQVEQLVRKLLKPATQRHRAMGVDPQREAVLEGLTEKLKTVFGTKVDINQISKKKGRIEIEYYSDDDLERLYELLMTVKAEDY